MEKAEKKLAYFEEDYVRSARIPESDTLPEINFRYKPLNMIQSANLTDAVIEGKNIIGAAEATRQMISKHIVEWDIIKADGTLVSFSNEKELSKVSGMIIQKIASIIRGDSSTFEEDAKVLEAEIKN